MQNLFCFSLPGAEPSARDAVVGTNPGPDPSQGFTGQEMILQRAEHISWEHPSLSETPLHRAQSSTEITGVTLAKVFLNNVLKVSCDLIFLSKFNSQAGSKDQFWSLKRLKAHLCKSYLLSKHKIII